MRFRDELKPATAPPAILEANGLEHMLAKVGSSVQAAEAAGDFVCDLTFTMRPSTFRIDTKRGR
jgi:hypothetical protein